jgi:hypothetical protein
MITAGTSSTSSTSSQGTIPSSNSSVQQLQPPLVAPLAERAGLPQGQVEVPQMELKNADRPGWA